MRAHSLTEAYLYLRVTPCPDCSGGPWQVQDQPAATADAPPQPPPGRALRARCQQCGARREFVLEGVEPPAGGLAPGPAEVINPTPAASEIIDLGQWVSLFYLLVGSADRAADKAETRRLTFQAAQCLDEALKFYAGDDELPPPSAFFVESSRQAFAEHPEKFARQRLRDLRGKLPDHRVMARHLARDANRKERKRWWPFWKS
ncbi:MAG: hypothetical protein AMJ81_05330 [Phycisphaerae bacterium SM23_33]|nr:MAG: hypothetical protein AMJ81_05330 [Phycisphaerae bacterium SM23_33]